VVSRGLFGVAVGMGLSAVAIQAGAAEPPSAVVAEINGQKLTRADLEQRQAAKLLQARYQHYLAEREALDELVNERLVEMQARSEQLSVEQLLQREVTSKVKEPTDDQLEVFYEGLRVDRPFAEVREQIVATIRQNRLAKARTAYLQALRSQASVMIALAPPEAELALDDAPRRGALEAPVVVVEFADYECPHCQRIHPDVKRLEREFGERLAFAFKDFPLPMHPRAAKAAEAARCAGAQGRFWDFQDVLFDGNHKFEPAQLKDYARGLKLDVTRFDRCLDAGEQAAAVQKDLAQAQRLGLTGTPSFFINGHFVSGAVKYDTLREIVEQQLAARTPGREVALK
jgi:protein-disulfide isomerase